MECIDVNIDFNDYEHYLDAPPCVLDIMDADEGYISNSADFLGRSTIYLKDIVDKISRDDKVIPVPEWFDIKYGTDPSSPVSG